MAAKDDINRLVKPPLPEISLNPPKTPAAIRAKTGLERKGTGDVNGTEVTAKSTDGLFTFIVTVVKV